jgi:O-antigen/teichoic acid export membrane protein
MTKTANPIKRLIGETAIYGLGTMLPRFLNLLLVPLYTIYVFTEAEYGEVTILYSYVAILLVLLTYGMETAFFRYANKNNDAKKVFNTATTSVLITAILFLVIIFAFVDDISRLIEYPSNNEYVLLIAIIIAIDAITSLPFAYLRYQNKAIKFSLIRIISVVITISLNLIFLIAIPYYYGDSYNTLPVYRSTSLVTFVFIANLTGSFSTLVMLSAEFKSFNFKIDVKLLRKMLKYGLPILIISLSFMITEVADKILLKYLLPDRAGADAQVGIYAASYKLAIIMMLFIQMFRYAAEPFFFSEADKKDAKKTYSKVMTLFVAFTWFIFLIVTLYLNLFKYIIGEAFWVGLTIVPIILSAKIFLGIFYNLSVWYKLTNKTIYGATIAILAGIVTIIMNVLLIPKYGYMGSAWANFASYFVIMIVSYLWGRKIYPINYEINKIIIYTIAAATIYYISQFSSGFQISTNYILNTFLLLVYVLFVYVIENQNKLQKKV